MGQGDGDRFGPQQRAASKERRLYRNGGQALDFDANGVFQGGDYNGLYFEQSALEAYRQSMQQAHNDYYAQSQESGPYAGAAGRMFDQHQSTIPEFVPPFANGGKIQGLQFGGDGKMYGVIESVMPDGTTKRAKIQMGGWDMDTSTLPAGSPGSFYAATVVPDESGNLLQINDGSQVVGWARQKLQHALEPDSRLGGGRGRTHSPGADPRVASTLLGGPVGDPRKVTTKG